MRCFFYLMQSKGRALKPIFNKKDLSLKKYFIHFQESYKKGIC